MFPIQNNIKNRLNGNLTYQIKYLPHTTLCIIKSCTNYLSKPKLSHTTFHYQIISKCSTLQNVQYLCSLNFSNQKSVQYSTTYFNSYLPYIQGTLPLHKRLNVNDKRTQQKLQKNDAEEVVGNERNGRRWIRKRKPDVEKVNWYIYVAAAHI